MDSVERIVAEFQKLTAIASPTGLTEAAADYAVSALTNLGFAPKLTRKGCVLCDIGGEGPALVAAAHIDTLGGMVAELKGNGRLRITNLGGLVAANIETENCHVHTWDGRSYEGTFQLNDPSSHVNTNLRDEKRDFTTMEVVLDERVSSKEETAALGIEIGNYVCFEPRTRVTESGYIKSRYIDDKLSVAILLELAALVARGERKLRTHTYLYFTVYEEVGHGCCASIPEAVEEILCVDMGCIGKGLTCDEHQVSICAKDARGPYSYAMTSRLIALAKELGLNYAIDVYPSYSSDGDAALTAGADIRHGLIGAGVYASHGYERTHKDGVQNTLALALAYICD